MKTLAGVVVALGMGAASIALAAPPRGPGGAPYVRISKGETSSVLPPDGKTAKAKIAAFDLRVLPVTNADMLAFVRQNPSWRRDEVATIFADEGYLSHWPSPTELQPEQLEQPVTRVSWFAAEAYCASEGGRLPTWYEWEYVAAADAKRKDARSDPAWRERILGWYGRPSNVPLANVGGAANAYGVRDMHGLVWEWVDDASGLMIVDDGRAQNAPETAKFCGAGAASMQGKDNYAVLMRVAMLSSLAARDTTKNMGFRCARDIEEVKR